MNQNIEDVVRKVLADKLDITLDKISLDSSLTDDLGVDSFGAIELIFELEERLSLKIPDDALKDVKTVRDIVNYIKAQTQNKESSS